MQKQDLILSGKAVKKSICTVGLMNNISNDYAGVVN